MLVLMSDTSKCALSLTAAFPVMLVASVAAHAVLGHGPVVPMPGVDVDLGLLIAWGMAIGAGDAVRRGVRHFL